MAARRPHRHRDSVTVCFRQLGPKGGVVREKDRFTTTTVGLKVLADWLGERQVDLVAMEGRCSRHQKPPRSADEQPTLRSPRSCHDQ